jgi:hypothetical protein
MQERTQIELMRGDGTEEIVLAVLIDGLAIEDADQADQLWEGAFFDLAAKYANAGLRTDLLPPSWVWDWRTKMEEEAKPEWHFFGIEYEGKMQGMLAIDIYQQPCAHSVGLPKEVSGLYLCYICAAPWNMGYYLRQVGEEAQFNDVGSALLEVAVYKSIECGCEGRLILHSLKEAEHFYRKRGMMEMGADNRHPQYLVRFELSAEGAKRLLE